ncbi:hypothetical protein [Rhizosaccharibacter radicis]|uniref:Uncharacterized protein n=1 Tax=Rhizosaccharibacter radicis TaxID=2782605 RepID=A0ABT1VWJ2_9PROT|nr:hypothetical protein [Acetobacteraceae bacterium KSS12]
MAIVPTTRVPCFICGDAAALAGETPGHIDYDCARCGRLRITGRAFHIFPPKAMATFDRLWLSRKVREIPTTRRNGIRRLVEERWLHHWRLVTLLKADHGLSDAEAEAAIARHPGVDITGEALLALVALDLSETRH